ncbi:hypothetical protein [Calothrix rhizosoleniae]|uniref:hypothetical protein n=1 Tax=Calothrix rhizosoleniae TaxID=888997 RepID=UPI000B4A509F|nr:hypothetical protein [Calothrix rhizosoleniae]
MKLEERQEYLELLNNTLQEHLRAEIPSGEFFQVKCVVKNERLMILTQHPQGVITDREKIFAVIEEALESSSFLEESQVEIFLRAVGSKLPYAKRDLNIVKEIIPSVIDIELPGEDIPQDEPVDAAVSSSLDDYDVNAEKSWAPALTEDDYDVNTEESSVLPPTMENSESQDFDPLADAPDLSHYSTIKHRYSTRSFILCGGLLAITMFGLGAYVVTRPCVISGCQPIQVATELQQKPFRLQGNNTSPMAELTKLQTEIEQAIASLKQIPPWSSRHQEVEPLTTKLSAQEEEVNLLLKALQVSKQAVQKTQTPKQSLQELQSTQQLWRQAILPLEAINSKSPFYGWVSPTLSVYRRNLQTVNRRLRTEDKWLKKLESAKSVGIVAQKRQGKAKSLQELQKTQSTWEVVVNALNIIPPNSLAHADAQKLLVQYKPKLANARLKAAKEQMANKTYNQALNAAKQAQIYEKQNQWQASVNQWNQAVIAIQQIYRDSSYYDKAKPLLTPYNNSLKRAKTQLQVFNQLQRARTDLGKTCVNSGIAICNFTVNLQAIAVRITSEYEQVIAKSYENNSSITTTNHLQTLQQALEIISDNAGIPLAIYDAQGNQIYQHTPRR